jgi:hypothetical protein
MTALNATVGLGLPGDAGLSFGGAGFLIFYYLGEFCAILVARDQVQQQQMRSFSSSLPLHSPGIPGTHLQAIAY